MENEATNTIQERLIKNPHLAASLRRKLLEPKGRFNLAYEPDAPFRHVLESLSNEQLIAKYVAHRISRFVASPEPVSITSVRVL